MIKGYKDCLLVCGDTFDKKTTIKKYKGLWNPEHRGWIIKHLKHKDSLLSSLKKNTKNVEYNTIDNTLLKKCTKSNNYIDNEDSDEMVKSPIASFAFLHDE